MDLKSLESLLGEDVFFVPCEWGTKKPLVTYVERPFEATKTEAYRALFEVQEVNVAVYLGRASGGLCAIDFDRDEDLAAFLAANPALGATTHSRGSRGGMLWLRMKSVRSAECGVRNEKASSLQLSPPLEERVPEMRTGLSRELQRGALRVAGRQAAFNDLRPPSRRDGLRA